MHFPFLLIAISAQMPRNFRPLTWMCAVKKPHGAFLGVDTLSLRMRKSGARRPGSGARAAYNDPSESSEYGISPSRTSVTRLPVTSTTVEPSLPGSSPASMTMSIVPLK